MLLRNFGRVALSAVAALVTLVHADNNDTDIDNPSGQSTFISPGSQIAFALTVPDHGNADIYFALRVPVGISWGAVGLGSDDMAGALFLMLYLNEAGDNVTFSPRVAYGNYEPAFYDEADVEPLPGTGVFEDHMVFVARCSNCRNWPAKDSSGGMIDVNSPSQKGIYAFGPKENYGSDSTSAPLMYHQEYGSFTIDMGRTKGAADAPVLDEDTVMEGTQLNSRHTGKSDWKATLHGVVMILCIVGLMPAGVVLLRFGGWVRWHAVNQTVALVGVLGGFALGILSSFYYQRSRGFKSTHQVVGFIIVAFLLCQFLLGFLHHKQYKATQAPSRYGKIHLWLGRLILFLGTLNAFLGFTFALNRQYGMILAGIIILVCFGSLALLFGKRYLDSKRGRPQQDPLASPPQYQSQDAWRQPQASSSSAYPSDPPPGYEPPSNQDQIGLRPMSPWRPHEGKNDDYDGDLGSEQRPREFS